MQALLSDSVTHLEDNDFITLSDTEYITISDTDE
jgi:hypothetical protein